MTIVPITLRQANRFIAAHHRHNKPVRGIKFAIGLVDGDDFDPKHLALLGVAACGRPIARHLDDGLTLEINRTCTTGAPNANSALYGACRAIAKGMGYRRVITYTQATEGGGALRGAGFVKVADLPPRKGWADSSGQRWLGLRDPVGNGGVARVLWEVRFA